MIILGTNSIKDTGYDVANSCRFNSGDSAKMSRTIGTPTSNRKFTVSCWVKLATLGTQRSLWGIGSGDASGISVRLQDDDTLDFFEYHGSGNTFGYSTNQKFRDVSAWSHFLFAVDTEQGTAHNRVRIYYNGTEIDKTNLTDNPGDPTQNVDLTIASGDTFNVADDYSSSNEWDGYIGEFVYIDGLQLDPTSFGEFDEDSGIWKPIDVSGLTFGTNGFYLDFEDSSALGNDVSGNNNDFTVNNLTAIDQSTDTCTNNMPTMNPLIKVTTDSIDFVDGNLSKNDATGDNWRGIISTFAMTSGKWYWEQKVTGTKASNPRNIAFGVVDISQFSQTTNQEFYATSRAYGYNGNLGYKISNASGSSYGDSFTTDDIIGVALDLDNNKIYFSKNGTFQNSGDPTSGSTGTGAAFSITDGYDYTPAFSSYHSEDKYSVNFGSPPYSISSGNADGNGYGNFEYAVPSGYYSLNTKNLSEYG